MNSFPSRETVGRIRKQYPIGTRVELIHMEDPYSKLKAGDQGIITGIDDIGTAFVAWDCGSSLGLVFGEDVYKKVDGRVSNETNYSGTTD